MDLAEQLRTKKICRFCLAQDVQLTDIISDASKSSSLVPLSLQIMAVVSIEVFINDGLPSKICENCRFFVSCTYKFKQVCKEADQALKQFPSTGIWPQRLKLPLELKKVIGKAVDPPSIPKVIAVQVPVEKAPKESPPQAKRRKLPVATNVETVETEIYHLPVINSLDQIKIGPHIKSQSFLKVEAISSSPPKLLNKSPPKILNKGLTNEVATNIITKSDGNIEIVQILELSPGTQDLTGPETELVNDSNVYTCEVCQRSFPLRQLLDIHAQNHERERNFDCQWCEKKFFSKYDLAKHTMTHTGDKPYKCNICNKSFSRSTLLARHKKIHIDAPQFLCTVELCEQYFVCEEDLVKHMELKHLKKRPFRCTKCDKSFAFKQGLERHEVIHDEAQPFPCEYCDKSFGTAGKLAKHLVAHAGTKRRYPCKDCPKSFTLSHHLTRHMRSHNKISSYKCGYTDCTLTFGTKDELIYHSAVHATQSLSCPLCEEQFDDIDATTAHIELHSKNEQFACDYCDLIFVTESKLNEHICTKDELLIKEELDRNVEASDPLLDTDPKITIRTTYKPALDPETPPEVQQALQKLSKRLTIHKQEKVKDVSVPMTLIKVGNQLTMVKKVTKEQVAAINKKIENKVRKKQ